MFRNSYLDTYKHAVLYNKQVQFLFVHLSQMYTTLGSVINDIEYQFGLILAQAERSTRNGNKQSYGSKPNQANDREDKGFTEIQNQLENYAQDERKKVSQVSIELKPASLHIQPPKARQQATQRTQKRSSRDMFAPAIQSTQDFDALFLPVRQQTSNQNSFARQGSKPNNKTARINQPDINKSNTNKKSQQNTDFFDKLFGN